MRWTPRDWLERLPGPATDRWPEGERFVRAFDRGAVSVELYAPVGHDPQTPHEEDELYFIAVGEGVLSIDGVEHPFAPGDMFFVPAHATHRFERFCEGFAAWAVFWPATG